MADANPNKVYPVSWDELHRNSKALAWRLLELGPWQGLVAVTRGGMVPAAIVARELEIRVIETVSVVSYQSSGAGPQRDADAKIVKAAANIGEGEGWLVVDDLVDTGCTVDVLRRVMPKAHFAAVYAKPLGRPLIDTFITEVSQDTWIYFPWDIDLQFSHPIATQRQ